MKNYNQLYINGQWIDSTGNQKFSVINPANQKVCALVVMATEQDVNSAVKAARKAFNSWKNTTAEYRANLIEKLADALVIRQHELATAISLSMGIPLHLALEVQVEEPIEILRSYAKRCILMDQIDVIGNATVIKKPIGVCGLISPWNYPLNQLMGKIAPALAAGCTVIVKPSEQTSLQDFIVAECCHEVGLPAGVFNLVTGLGPEVGAAMSGHKDIDLISFTGSTRAGIHIAQNAATTVKRVVQELGGKSPLIITEDANLEAAIEYGLEDVLLNTGQTCTAYTRWLIPENKLDDVSNLILNKITNYKIGSNETAFIGPMVTATQQKRVQEYIQLGINEGAKILTGGLGLPDNIKIGYYVKPTIFTNVKNSMRIAQEEIFGPVICLITYQSIEQAIEIANDSPYGLASAVFSGTSEAGIEIAKQIDSGITYINGGDYNIEAPFGGVKQSGNGREFGDHGLNEYIELQAIHV
ncbi:MAG: aldehyde dehydrogenase (NAD+) [Psychrobacter glaciei]|jgi:aldehyde dehydrogenase (NAD+)